MGRSPGLRRDPGSGEFPLLLGPSGCGKTTLLRLIDVLTQGGPGGATTDVYRLFWRFGFHDVKRRNVAAANQLRGALHPG